MKTQVYLDHNATAPMSSTLAEQLPELLNAWGNPSSIHISGRDPKNLIRKARLSLAKAINVSPLEIIFNSGASEGNTTVILGLYEILHKKKNHFMCSLVEHPSVIKCFQYIESKGARVDYIPVDRDGKLDLQFIRNKISTETALISVMYANNETGNIYPIREVVEIAHSVGALVHSDCVQTLGRLSLDLNALGVDYASFSAHKFYSLKGTGALYVKRNSPFQKLIYGGAQERSRRGGTENTLGIAAFGIMCERLDETSLKSQQMCALRDDMEERILNEISDVTINAENSERLCNTSSMIIKGIDGETLLMSLDLKGFSVSTGAACSSGNPEPSPVLLAMGLSRAEAQSSLRVSLGWGSTKEEIDLFIVTLKETVARLRSLSAASSERNIQL